MEDMEVLQPNAVTPVRKQNPSAKQEGQQQHKEQPQIESDFENVETVQCLRYLFKVLRFLGLYAPQNKKFLYFCWSFVFNMFITIYQPVGYALGMTLSRESMEIGDILTSVTTCVSVFCCSLKLILVGILLPKLLKCERIIQRLDKRCHTTEEKENIKSFIKKGNRIVVVFSSCYFSYSLSNFIRALVFKSLPYNIYNPFIDSKSSYSHFFLAVCIEFNIINMACLQQMVSDTYPIIYVGILKTHFDILLKRIANLNKTHELSVEGKLKELKMCIIDHKNIIELFDEVSTIISKTILLQFSITAMVLGITLINITLFANSFISIVSGSIYIFSVVSEIFPLCYYAQCFDDVCNCLSDVIFHSDWPDQDIRYKKMLIIFMQRSQVTFKLTAGNLFPINLASFGRIAKFSFSLFTLMKKMSAKE